MDRPEAGLRRFDQQHPPKPQTPDRNPADGGNHGWYGRLFRWALMSLSALLLAITMLTMSASPAYACTGGGVTLDITPSGDDSMAFFTVTCAPAACTSLVGASSSDSTIVTVTPTNVEIGATPFQFKVSSASGSARGSVTISISYAPNDYPACGSQGGSLSPVIVNIIGPPEGTSAANSVNSGSTSDPVNTFTGELTFTEKPELELGGPMPLFFQRYYASRLRLGFIVADLGANWRHNFDWSLNISGNTMRLVTNKGKVLQYLKEDLQSTDWVLQDVSDVPFQVIEDGTDKIFGDPTNDRIYRFNGAGKLIEVTDGKGNSHILTYNNNEKLASVRDHQDESMARILRFTYSEVNGIQLLTQVREEIGATGVISVGSVSFSYTGNLLVMASNAINGVTEYVYDTDHADVGLLKWKIFPETNIAFRQTYGPFGKVATQTDAFGNVTTFDFGDPFAPGTTTVTAPDGTSFTDLHDAGGALTSRAKSTGGMLAFTNDSSGRRLARTNRRGKTSTLAFDAVSGKIASDTTGDGDRTAIGYTSRTDATGAVFRDLTSISYPDGASETFRYDGNGNLISKTDQLGATWTFTYDNRGQVLTATNPLGGVITNTYNSFANVDTVTDNAGNLTRFRYDNLLRLDRITWADGTFRSFGYDLMDRRTSLTDEAGGVHTFVYDRNSYLTSQTDPLGGTIRYAFDAMGRITQITDADGRTSNVTYDSLGRFAGRTDRTGAVTSNAYSTAGHLDRITDQAGNAWQTNFDADGRITGNVDPLGNTTVLTYTSAGMVATATDALGGVGIFTYDSLDRLITERDELGRNTHFAYDAAGRVTEIRLETDDLAVQFARNAMGQVTSITDPSGNVWQREYDVQGRMISATDPNGRKTSYAYNGRNQRSKITFPDGKTMTVTFNSLGAATTRQFSDGTIRFFTYDASGRRTSGRDAPLALDVRHDIVDSNGITITRDNETRIATMTLAPGKVVTYTYDGRGKMTSVKDWQNGEMTFAYDAAGRMTGWTRHNGQTTTFSHDANNQTTRIQHGTLGDIQLTRDATGRIRTADRVQPMPPTIIDSSAPTRAYDKAGQITGVPFLYDTTGRLTRDESRTYSWDLSSRLRSYTESGATVSFTYDSFGNVLARGARGFVWNYALDLPSVSIIREGGTDQTYFIHAPDGTLLYRIDAASNARLFYHYDEMGNTLFLTDNQGQVTDSYAYTPYGVITDSSGTTDNPFTFAGALGVIQEADTGLYIMRQRIYDSLTRRFITRDPFGSQSNPLITNPYQFAGGDPLRFADPSGENLSQSTQSGLGGLKTGLGIGGNVVGAAAAPIARAIQRAAPRSVTSLKGLTGGIKGAASGAGTIGTVLGAALEVQKTSDRMDEIIDRFEMEGIRARDVYKGGLEIAFQLLKERKITSDEYVKLRRALKAAWEAAVEANQANLGVDSLSLATISTLNLLTNLLPVPFIPDAANFIQYTGE